MKKQSLSKLFLLTMCGFLFNPVLSAKEKKNEINIYWSGPWKSSYHFDRESVKKDGTNESNGIWGFGLPLRENWEFYFKKCINSKKHLSNWIGANWRFYNRKNFEAGVEGFIIDGYPGNDYKFALGIAGNAKFKYKDFSFTIHLPPPKKYTTEWLGLKSLENLDVMVWDFGYKYKF